MGGEQLSLLDYPHTPGWVDEDTSIRAAEAIAPEVEGIRLRIMWLLRRDHALGLTADEAAYRLQLTPLAVRPRFTELRALGKIKDSGLRRKNESGKPAIVWIIKEDGEGQ